MHGPFKVRILKFWFMHFWHCYCVFMSILSITKVFMVVDRYIYWHGQSNSLQMNLFTQWNHYSVRTSCFISLHSYFYSCSRELNGYASVTCTSGQPEGNCDLSDVSVMISSDCQYCPSQTQPNNASIMDRQYLTTVCI